MKILYFDCFAGAAGDMILGALLDAGLPFDALKRALGSLGFSGASGVRVGRYLTLSIDAASEQAAREQLDEMCGKLLANPITEDYELKVSAA